MQVPDIHCSKLKGLAGVASSDNVHVNFRDNPSTAPTVERRDTHKQNGDFTSPLIFFLRNKSNEMRRIDVQDVQ